ncbi:hypothetical protein [Paraburkholderia xenovorans]
MEDLKQRVEALRDRSLVLGALTKKYLAYTDWSPIIAALLLSGVRPSDRWADVPPADGHRDEQPISHADLFAELLSSMKRPERGLDNEPVVQTSIRFQNAKTILLFWDQVCNAHKDYPNALPPRDFVAWIWDMSQQGYVHIPDHTWIDAFINNYSLKHFDRVLPKEVLAWLTMGSKKARALSPKHKFGREIAMARLEAQQAGEPTDDPDEILFRLAEMMRNKKVDGVKLKEYRRKSDIVYTLDGEKDPITLRRDSFARQLRRMIAKGDASSDAGKPRAPSTGGFPDIKAVTISTNTINRFTSNEQLMKLARDLFRETTAYVRLAASLRVSDKGWPREDAVLVGNMVRLSKLLTSIGTFAELKLAEMLALTVPLAIETMVDLKYLIANFNPRLIGSYVGSPEKRTPNAGLDWAALDLKEKANAIGFGDVYTYVLQDAPAHLHGSWKDLTTYHLTNTGDERFHAKLAWTEPNPQPLVTTSMLALVVTQGFADLIASGPPVEELQNRIVDLFGRLKIADEGFDQFLDGRW